MAWRNCNLGVLFCRRLQPPPINNTATSLARAPNAQMAGAQDGLGLGPPIGQTEASDVLAYVTDVAVSVGSLLHASGGVRAAPTAAGVSRTSGRGGGGGLGLLAWRLQGADGEVSPEGLAAALALTFEATLPALEGLLLTPAATASGKVCEEELRRLNTGSHIVRCFVLRECRMNKLCFVYLVFIRRKGVVCVLPLDSDGSSAQAGRTLRKSRAIHVYRLRQNVA